MTSAANRRTSTSPSSVVADLVAGLTRAEQVSILTGSELFETTGVERLGIPRIRLLDGPAGVRGTEFLAASSLSVPCGTALGATWDPNLVELVGGVLGRQARAKGARVHLAPTLNLCRVVVGGRNFESFGEDPLHVATLGAAYVRGVQNEGVASCVKHFVGNDTEHERFTINSQIDERTLREVYLRPFEAAVRAGAGAIMAAYNCVNGTTMSENHRLLNEILRDEWGFTGPVVSDWYGVRSTVEALVGGTDLEMPGPGAFRGAKLLAAIDDGLIDPEAVATSVQRVLSLIEQFGGLADGGPGVETTHDNPADRMIVRRAATEAIVLLKNRLINGEPALPLLATSSQSIAVLGPNAAQGQIGGGGSAMVRPTLVSHPLSTLRSRLHDATVEHAPGCSIDIGLPMLNLSLCHNLRLEVFDDPDAAAAAEGTTPGITLPMNTTRLLWFRDPFDDQRPPRFSARLLTTFTPDRDGCWTFGFRSVGDGSFVVNGTTVADNSTVELAAIAAMGKPEVRFPIEMVSGIPYELEFRLRRESDGDGLSGILVGATPPVVDDPIGEAVAIAARADVTVLVVGTNGDWETEGRDRETIDLPGDQNELIRRVAEVSVKTIVVVNAGSPISMPWLDSVDAVVMAWFPGELLGDALTDVLTGVLEPTGRLPVTFPHSVERTPTASLHPGTEGLARYAEGRLIGHRWFDAHDEKPLFPFGFGLGYSQIEIRSATASDSGNITVTVANTSDSAGTQVVQLYAEHERATDAPADEPVRVLAGFARVDVAPHTTATVEVDIDRRALQYWDEKAARWRNRDGEVTIHVGTSSRHLAIAVRLGA